MADNVSSNNRLAKNSVFLTIRMVIVLAISLYTTRVILRVLGVDDYGVYNVVCGFVSMFTFLNASMSNGIQRFYNFELGKHGEDGANKVYCTAMLIQAILAIVIIILTESFGLWYLHHKMVITEGRELAAEWIFQFSIVSFLFVIMQAPYMAAVMAHEKMDFFAFVSVFDAVLKLIIVLVLPLFAEGRLIVYGFLFALISVINFILYYAYSKKFFPEIRLHREFNRDLFKSMLGFSGWNLFGSFSAAMQTQGINLVLNYFFGPVVNAARGVAVQVKGGLDGFVSNITMPVRPQVVQSFARGDLSRTMNLTYTISKLSCCFLLLMALPVSIEINYILHLWLGENVPAHTAAFTIIVLFSSLTSNLNAATSNVIHATGIMRDYQLWGSIVKISSIPISIAILHFYQVPELALLAVMVCGMVGHFVCLLVVRKVVGISLMDYFKKVIVPIFIVFVFSVTIVYPIHLIMNEGFVRLIIVTFMGVSSVALSLYFFAFNKSERQLSSQLIVSFIRRFQRKNKTNGNE